MAVAVLSGWLLVCSRKAWLSAHILTLMPIFRSSGSGNGRVGRPLRLTSATGDSRGHGAGAVISSRQHSRNVIDVVTEPTCLRPIGRAALVLPRRGEHSFARATNGQTARSAFTQCHPKQHGDANG